MPLYYEAGNHVPGINSITKTATDLKLRDFLLSKNIQNPIKYPQLSTSPNGGPRGGEPVLDTMVGSGAIINHPSVEADGLLRYIIAVLPNRFINTELSAPQLLEIDDVPTVPIFPVPNSGSVNYKDEDLNKYGLLAKSDDKKFREKTTLRNLYVDTVNQIDIADTISLQPIQTSSQVKGGYLDEYGSLNLGQGGVTQAADILGSIINGQGVGLSSGGIAPVSNFDIRSSLAGRVLNAAGVIKDSKLGVIGAQQIALALGNNAAFNVQQQILGKLNVQENIVSLIKGDGLAGFRPDFTITTPSSTGGKILSFAERILGFNLPHSFLQSKGSLFTSESGIQDNISRTNAMLQNTGVGQIAALAKNVNATLFGNGQGYDDPRTSAFRSGYAPGYKDHNGNELFVPVSYAFMNADGTVYNFVGSVTKDKPIPDISWNREGLVKSYGFIDPETSYYYNVTNNNNGGSTAFRTKFAWTSQKGEAINLVSDETSFQGNNTKKSLLVKTQKLFNSKGMKSLISVKGDMTASKSQIQTVSGLGVGISKGSAVLNGSLFDSKTGTLTNGSSSADNVFCRAWTPYNRYDSVNKLIRHRGLDQQDESGNSFFTSNDKASGWRQNVNGSVLDDNGFVKIGPYKDDVHETEAGRVKDSPKKYMFSIENLAWGDSESQLNLLPEEKGPGDLLTGVYGRIMWFPPYDITFSETSSVNLESTNFIGRGEPVYTYNNTERTGNLSFKIIVDHPSVMNAFAGDNYVEDEFIDSFIAGCTDLDSSWLDKLTDYERNKIETVGKVPVESKAVEQIIPPSDFKIYFPNDVTEIDTILNIQYELLPLGTPHNVTYQGEPQFKSPTNKTPEPGRNFTDKESFALNKKPLSLGDKNYDTWNSYEYTDWLVVYFNEICPTCKAVVRGSASNQINTSYANKQLAINRANNVVKFLIGLGLDKRRVIADTKNSVPSNNTSYNNKTPNTNKNVKEDRFASITFEVIPEKTDTSKENTVYKKVTTQNLSSSIKRRFYTEVNFFEKLKQDDPFIFDKIRDKIKYFHPAFHSMTPEGLNSRLTFLLQCTKAGRTNINDNPKNLAFGRQPVCILRVGDFYNTKIMMDNVSFDFEPLVWDLNPEGVGVQPMIANVTISFKFIGASSLYGPINKLQNALSFNYFANAQVYDARADYIVGNNGNKYTLNTGLSAMSNTYTISSEVVVDPSSTNDANQIATANNVPSPPISASTSSSSDETIFSNAALLGNYYLKNLSYDSDGKLSGNFFITGDNEGIQKQHPAKLSIIGQMDGYIEISNFTINSNKDDKPGRGNFTTKSGKMQSTFSTAAQQQGNGLNLISLVVTIPEFSSIKYYFNFSQIDYDCPDEGYKANDLVPYNEFKTINENPCCNCYSGGYTAKKEYIFNGVPCPFSGC